MHKLSLLACYFVCLSAALAQVPDDLDALKLADSVSDSASPAIGASDWHWFAEGALGQSLPRQGSPSTNRRLSLDLQFDRRFAPDWRAVLSDRLDQTRQDLPTRASDINTLREAYLSWQPQTRQLLDLGRINIPYGVASGYNPTDFFRGDALRSVVSLDPASLKKNRMGSVMLRGQTLWDSGSVTALYSPRLEQQPNPASFSPDLGATNHQDRWLIAVSQKIYGDFAPQWLLYGNAGQAAQLGMNLTSLLNDATVAYLEYSGGRSNSMLAQALQGKDDSAFRNRLATGLTYTASNKLSLTLEYEYNGNAPSEREWSALKNGAKPGLDAGPALAYLQYRKWQQAEQELASRQEVFFYASWPDAMVQHLDLAAMQKFNLADRSRLSWIEARYHLERMDLALQWQGNNGDPTSAYGATPQKHSWQALLRYYF